MESVLNKIVQNKKKLHTTRLTDGPFKGPFKRTLTAGVKPCLPLNPQVANRSAERVLRWPCKGPFKRILTSVVKPCLQIKPQAANQSAEKFAMALVTVSNDLSHCSKTVSCASSLSINSFPQKTDRV